MLRVEADGADFEHKGYILYIPAVKWKLPREGQKHTDISICSIRK